MEVYQIKVFLEVARSLNFTEAAETLNLTQPAVSAQIKNLEAELGTLLFHRLGRKIQLTEVGEFLQAEGGKLVTVEADLKQRVHALTQGQTGKLVLGSTAAMAQGWLPQYLWEYAQNYPGVQVQLQTFEQVQDLHRALSMAEIDVGVSEATPLPCPDLQMTNLGNFRYTLVASPEHPLAGRSWVSLADLQTEPLVVLPPGTPSRVNFAARLQELGLGLESFAQVQTVDTPALLRTYVLQGNYLGFASDLEFQVERQAGQLISLNLLEFAFPYHLHLLLPKRIADVPLPKRHRGSSPLEKLLGLLCPGSKPHAMPVPERVNSTRNPDMITIHLGVQNATIPSVTAGLIIQRLGLLEKFLPRQGRYRHVQYQLQWRNYPSGGPIVADLHNHSLDFGILGDYPLLVSALANPAQGQAHTHLIGFTAANADGSGNAIIVPQRSQIRDIQDLRGHTLALPLGSAAHGMVLRSLAAAQLLEDVELVFLKPDLLNLYPPERADADSYAHFAPFPELACRKGQYRYLAQVNSAQLPAFYGIVAAAEFAQHHPDIVVAYLQALQAAQAWYTSTADAPTLVGQWLGYDPELVAQILNPNPVYSPQEGGSGMEQRHFFPTLDLRPDWITQHINQLGQVRGNESIREINLDDWIRPEFLQQVAG